MLLILRPKIAAEDRRAVGMGSFAAEDYLYRSLDKGAPVSFKFPDGQGVRYKAGPPVDASGETAQAEPFQNFADFQRLTVSKPKKVARAFAAQMITYATGAEPGYADRREINRILSETKAQHFGLRSMVHAIAQSRLFQQK